jgi:hypothetical protein
MTLDHIILKFLYVICIFFPSCKLIQCVQYSKLTYIPLEDCNFTYITTGYAAEIQLSPQAYMVNQRLEHLHSINSGVNI